MYLRAYRCISIIDSLFQKKSIATFCIELGSGNRCTEGEIIFGHGITQYTGVIYTSKLCHTIRFACSIYNLCTERLVFFLERECHIDGVSTGIPHIYILNLSTEMDIFGIGSFLEKGDVIPFLYAVRTIVFVSSCKTRTNIGRPRK